MPSHFFAEEVDILNLWYLATLARKDFHDVFGDKSKFIILVLTSGTKKIIESF